MIAYPSEEIPDDDFLFMRVHVNFMSQGLPAPGAFKNHGDGMSTDWNRYSTPEETQKRAKDPSKNGVIAMLVGDIRRVPRQQIAHTPIPTNRAHTDVLGEKDEEARMRFRRICKWAIPFAPLAE